MRSPSWKRSSRWALSVPGTSEPAYSWRTSAWRWRHRRGVASCASRSRSLCGSCRRITSSLIAHQSSGHVFPLVSNKVNKCLKKGYRAVSDIKWNKHYSCQKYTKLCDNFPPFERTTSRTALWVMGHWCSIFFDDIKLSLLDLGLRDKILPEIHCTCSEHVSL